MSTSFPKGSGVRQGGGAGRVVHLSETQAVEVNEPEFEGEAGPFSRPEPTDPGGDNCQGWMKTSDYDDGYYGGDSGAWKQV